MSTRSEAEDNYREEQEMAKRNGKLLPKNPIITSQITYTSRYVDVVRRDDKENEYTPIGLYRGLVEDMLGPRFIYGRCKEINEYQYPVKLVLPEDPSADFPISVFKELVKYKFQIRSRIQLVFGVRETKIGTEDYHYKSITEFIRNYDGTIHCMTQHQHIKELKLLKEKGDDEYNYTPDE